jgi:serine/threonine protein kinase
MALKPGDRLGPYEVVAPAGAGGMGEVYRARDTRLDRTVAIKVLPSHRAAEPQLRERFEREARAVASLNHPHICTLHDVGRQDGVDFLVMEYLEGETLFDRLKKGPLPIPQALQYAVEIADAMDKAHRAGIVHRDLKPGNIFLTRSGGPSGQPITKLLDFGLAKSGPAVPGVTGPSGAVALASAVMRASMAATEATPLTMDGTLLGTIPYMAPEQIEGREADARTDIFAFGAVLYEMVTARRAFQGKSQVSVMAAIIDQEPEPVSAIQPATPFLFGHCIRTCLAKNPDDRWQHAGDLRIQLELIRSGAAQPAPVKAPSTTKIGRLAWGIAAGLFATTIALAATRLLRPATAPPQRISFEIETPSAASPLQNAISPDGTRLATIVSGTGSPNLLWVRALDNLSGQVLPGTDNAQHPFWSPDGRTLGFFADGKLKKIDRLGSPPLILCDAPVGAGGTWSREGVIVFAPDQNGPLFRVSATGGVPVAVTALDLSAAESSHRFPFFLPDGDHFLYTVLSSKEGQAGIYVGSLSSMERTKLIGSSTLKAAFAAPDHLLFMQGTDTVMAQRFDPRRLELEGDPFPAVAESIGFNLSNSAAGFSVSENGILAYRSGNTTGRQLTWLDESGRPAGALGVPGTYLSPAISGNGQRVAVERRDGITGDIWLFDPVRGTSSRFTFDPGIDTAPLWSPDSRRIVFASNRGNTFDLYLKDSGGVGQEQPLLTSPRSKEPDDWSRDGRFLLYRELHPQTGWDLWVLPFDGDRKAQRSHRPRSGKSRAGSLPMAGSSPMYRTSRVGTKCTCRRSHPRAANGRSRSQAASSRAGAPTGECCFSMELGCSAQWISP